jgi:succinate dehydrogenase / fumarate reductase cytochrome b subunit
MTSDSRPLSPFLIYRWQISNTLSILHRATGVALFFGAITLVAWVYAVADGPDAYAKFSGLFRGPVGVILIAGWVFSFYYHLANGIRHLFWDVGMGFEPARARATGWIVVLVSLLMTALTCVLLLI